METTKKRKKFELPHVYTIAFILIIVFGILTWIIPSGQFERTTIETAAGEREVAVAGTYQQVDKVDSEGNDLRQGIMEILMAPTRGIQAASDVVAFVLLIGGTFAIITKTNALNAGMNRLIKRLHGKDILIIPIVMTLLSIGGTTFGMSEEALPFYAIFMCVFLSLGYDSMTAFMVCFMGPQIGYCASTVNPFNVLIAQGVAGIHGNPQLGFRFIQWIIFTALGIAWVMMYAKKVKKNPECSITYKDDFEKKKEFLAEGADVDDSFSLRQKLVLVTFAVGMGIIVFGLVKYGWYMDEISMVFLGMGLLAGIIGGLSEKEMATEFVNGMKDFAYAAVIIGIARGILVVAEGGMIIDTILNAMASVLSGVPAAVFTTIMYIFQSIMTILVPSSSGLAALTIPVMAPLTD
ncbi:MAG: YfcC family protein, partial [Acetivibrio ethanolgignens]